MKINKAVFKIIIIIVLIIMCNTCISYARDDEQYLLDGGSGSTSGNSESSEPTTSVGLPDLDLYEPELNTGTKAITIISSLLGVLTVVGAIVGVVVIALIGFNTILGSASEKAIAQEKFIGIIVAALVISLGSFFARIIINIAETI